LFLIKKTRYQQLRLTIPSLEDNERAPTGQILIHAVELITSLKVRACFVTYLSTPPRSRLCPLFLFFFFFFFFCSWKNEDEALQAAIATLRAENERLRALYGN
jgi:hypothetical protein